MIRSILREVVLFGACGIFVATLGLILVDTVIMPRIVRKGIQVEVPDIIDLAPNQARQKLGRRGLRLKLQEPRWDASIPEGRIVYQIPAPAARVKTNRTVYGVPSRGTRLFAVPDIRKASLRQAMLLVEQSGLTVGEILKEASPSIKEGFVISQDPLPRQMVPVGTPVTIAVSDGPPGELVLVPSVIGKSLKVARSNLKNAGLKVRDIRYQFSTRYLPNTVIRQIPAAKDTVHILIVREPRLAPDEIWRRMSRFM